MPTESTENKFPSLSDAIADAFKAAEPKETEKVEAQETVDVADTETAEVAAEPEQKETEEKQEKADEPAPIDPPASWSDTDKAAFNALTSEGKKWALSRDEYYNKPSELSKAFDPYRERMRLAGMSETQAVQQLLAAQAFLEKSPGEAIKYFAKQYSVDLSQLLPQKAEQEDQYTDPQVKQLQTELKSLRDQLGQSAQQQQQMASLQQQVETFRNAKNDKGEPAHPHFDRVRTEMAQLVQTGIGIEEAYSRALWLNSDTRSTFVQAEVQKALKAQEEKAEADRKAKVAAAKKAATKPNGKAPADATEKPRSLSQAIEMAFAQHS